ncbi:MAG: IS200/IS605 family transposase [Planctomycetales bacterium]|nr:IS200/IS605 family transposase [Planctomycetales bacterium]
MSQSLSNVIVHLVFSTKDRLPHLNDQNIREQMHAELGGTSKTLNCPPIIVGGVEDHIHLLARQSRTITLSDWVKELKRVTSIWIKDKSQQFNTFAWQSGYVAFSVSQSQLSKVIQYIQQQEEHHRKTDFKTEFRAFLNRHEIEYDEWYVWD